MISPSGSSLRWSGYVFSVLRRVENSPKNSKLMKNGHPIESIYSQRFNFIAWKRKLFRKPNNSIKFSVFFRLSLDKCQKINSILNGNIVSHVKQNMPIRDYPNQILSIAYNERDYKSISPTNYDATNHASHIPIQSTQKKLSLQLISIRICKKGTENMTTWQSTT